MKTSRPIHPDFQFFLSLKDKEVIELFTDLRENILELYLTDGEREAVQISAQSVRDQYDPAQKILAMN